MSRGMNRTFKPKICEVCLREFIPRGGRQRMCAECRKSVNNYKSDKRRYAVNDADARLRMNAAIRARHNESIIGEGYAERQMKKTLLMAGKVRTEL